MPEPVRLGYWFRFGLSLKRLHVARWQRMPDGSLLIVAACGLQLVDQAGPEVPEGLRLEPTAVDALRAMDGHQASRLCADCRAIFTRRAAA